NVPTISITYQGGPAVVMVGTETNALNPAPQIFRLFSISEPLGPTNEVKIVQSSSSNMIIQKIVFAAGGFAGGGFNTSPDIQSRILFTGPSFSSLLTFALSGEPGLDWGLESTSDFVL